MVDLVPKSIDHGTLSEGLRYAHMYRNFVATPAGRKLLS
jgi:hypothetical protein